MSEQRRFDWGPPVQTGEGLKEWLVYLVIAVILGIGGWFLLDINGRKVPVVSPRVKNIVSVDQKLETYVPNEKEQNIIKEEKIPESNVVQPILANKNQFYVQLGAFGDEPSANEILNMLRKERIEATLLKPDEQFEIYRLVVGPYDEEKVAEDKAEKLNEIGFPCFVVEAQ